MTNSAKYVYVFFAIIFFGAIVLLGYYFYISNSVNSNLLVDNQTSFYTFRSEVEGKEIAANGVPLIDFMQEPYEVVGGLKNINISLVNEVQDKISFVDNGKVYASAGIEKSRENRTVDVQIQVDTRYFDSQHNLDKVVSYLILKSVYSFQTGDVDQLDITLNEVLADYESSNSEYPFYLNTYDR